jgi:hypothetical protein
MTAQTNETRQGATFEDVREMFKNVAEMFDKTDREFEKSKAEYDRKFAESKAEHDRMIANHDRMIEESRAERTALDEKIAVLSRNIGGVNSSLGDMAEGLMASDLYETFAALKLDFDRSFENYKLKDRQTKRTLTEVDMLLLNGTIAMAVEVKMTMKRGDIDKHGVRLEMLRNKPNSLFAKRKLYGAMAAVKTSKASRQYAIDKGFFVIELSGNAIKVEVPEGWKPKTW